MYLDNTELRVHFKMVSGHDIREYMRDIIRRNRIVIWTKPYSTTAFVIKVVCMDSILFYYIVGYNDE